MPNYIGYVQTDNNAPTLFFDTGFLVQTTGNNMPPVGWYAYRNPYHYGANMDPDFVGGMSGLGMFKGMWDALNRHIKNEIIRQNYLRAGGQIQPPATNMYALVDTPHVEQVEQASFYTFAGALMVPGDPGFQPAFDAAHATAILGNLTPAGLPTQHPIVPTAVGITSFRK